MKSMNLAVRLKDLHLPIIGGFFSGVVGTLAVLGLKGSSKNIKVEKTDTTIYHVEGPQ